MCHFARRKHNQQAAISQMRHRFAQPGARSCPLDIHRNDHMSGVRNPPQQLVRDNSHVRADRTHFSRQNRAIENAGRVIRQNECCARSWKSRQLTRDSVGPDMHLIQQAFERKMCRLATA